MVHQGYWPELTMPFPFLQERLSALAGNPCDVSDAMTMSAISIMFYILLHICFVTQDVVCQDCRLCCYCLEKLVNFVFPFICFRLPQNGGQNFV